MSDENRPGLFRRFVESIVRRDPVKYNNLRQDLISARLGMTVEGYVARSVQFALLAGLFFGLLAYFISGFVHLPAGSIHIVNVLRLPMPLLEKGSSSWYLIRAIAFLVTTGIAGAASYALALRYPALERGNRETKINLSLHNSVSYIYAMRRGGAEIIDIFRSLSENAGIYGESAIEFRQVVRDADYFGISTSLIFLPLNFQLSACPSPITIPTPLAQ